jgi:threonine dehydrogenase-like Zn-dependent dehydrogenase
MERPLRAFAVTGVGQTAVLDVERPRAGTGQVVIDVARVGVCGTDAEFFTGDMEYLRQGEASYPVRIGHEWCGTVSAVGAEVDPSWLGARVTGVTNIGCGNCARCVAGTPWVCANRVEVGIRRGFPGALAEQLSMPVDALHRLPAAVDDTAGAMVEPGGNALRAVRAAAVGRTERLLIIGAGTIGSLAALMAHVDGLEVHVLGRSERSIAFARSLGLDNVWRRQELPDLSWHGVIDASNDASVPALALELVEPGGRLVLIGLAGSPSLIDSRTIALKDVTAVGILGASAGFEGTIESYASGAVDPRPLVAATVGLESVGDVLDGWRPPNSGGGPKILVDPRA